MNMNFNITFPTIPCYMVKVMQQNLDSGVATEIDQELTKTRTQHEIKLKSNVDPNTKDDRALKFPHFDSTKFEEKYN